MKADQIRINRWGATLLALCATVFSAGMAFAGPQKISGDLQAKTTANAEMVDVIVRFTTVPTAAHHEKILSRGGTIKRELGQFKGAAYSMPASALADLADDPDVVYISPDRPLKGASEGKPNAVNDYHIGVINAPAAWAMGLNGSGIGVAVIDSGIASLPDITAKNIVYSQDFTGLGSAADQYGHGTHVTGILAGNGAMSTGSGYSYTFKGIAGGVSIVNLRVLDENGAGSDSEGAGGSVVVEPADGDHRAFQIVSGPGAAVQNDGVLRRLASDLAHFLGCRFSIDFYARSRCRQQFRLPGCRGTAAGKHRSFAVEREEHR